jgi:TRL-like protein family
VRVPRAYRSALPADVKASPADRTVTGESCYQSLLYLVAWGDTSYAAATTQALRDDPGATLYDVKADAKVTSVLLGLYTRACTVVTGKVGHP